MTSIHRTAAAFGTQHAADGASRDIPRNRAAAQPFTRAGAPSRDRAIQFLGELCNTVNSRLGAAPFSFQTQGGQGILSRLGPNVIVCNGPDDFYLEIVNGRITDKNGQTDSQIAAFLRDAGSALG